MNLTNQLQKVGLTDKEARLYFSLLEAGEAAVQELTIRSGLNRTTAYIVLENLIKRGLIRRKYHKDKVVFSVESPKQILDLLENEKEDVEVKIKLAREMLSELEMFQKMTGEKAKIRFFEGKEGVKMIQDDIFKSGTKFVDQIYNINEALKKFPISPRDHRQRIKRKKIIRRTLIVYEPKEPIPKSPLFRTEERRYLPQNKIPFHMELVMYDKKLVILSSKNDYMGVVIENKAIIDGIKFIFELAWQGADKFLVLDNNKRNKKSPKK